MFYKVPQLWKGGRKTLNEANGNQETEGCKMPAINSVQCEAEVSEQHLLKHMLKTWLQTLSSLPKENTQTHTKKKTNPQKPWSFLTLITLIKLFSSRLGNAGLAVATSPLGCCWLTVSCTWLLIEETQPEQKMNNSKAYKGLLTSNWRKKNPACIKMPSNQNNPQFQSI